MHTGKTARNKSYKATGKRAVLCCSLSVLSLTGLLQHLPAILEATTAQLIASATEAERETDSAKRVPPVDTVVRATGAPTPTLTLQAAALLRLHGSLFKLWPYSNFQERPVGLFSTAAAAAELAAALMSRCGWACGGMPAPQLPAQAVRKLLPLFVLDVTRTTSQACRTMDVSQWVPACKVACLTLAQQPCQVVTTIIRYQPRVLKCPRKPWQVLAVLTWTC